MATAAQIIDYWIGEAASDPGAAKRRTKMWYGSKGGVDDEIRTRFADTLAMAEDGKLDDWQATGEGALGLVILLDQFSRNLYQRTADAFKNDPDAYRIAQRAIERGQDKDLSWTGRAFLYHPFHHSESLDAQNKGVELFEALRLETPEPWWEILDGFLDATREHRDIIREFGRFPHRNRVLGRKSTPEEQAYLENAKTYGQ